jgi:transposase
MITQRQVEVLPRWLKEAQESGIPELRSLAAGIYRDYDAVYGALETPRKQWANGGPGPSAEADQTASLWPGEF